MDKTYELIISGRVQGVGMRYFINRSASKFAVTGFVKNKYNGTVLSHVQGDEKEIDAFIEYIKRNAPGKIDDLVKTEIITNNEYHKFTVRLF